MIHTLATAATSITRLTRMVSKDLNQQFVLSLLELVNNSVVKGILVLLKPSSDVVADLFQDNEGLSSILSSDECRLVK